MDGLVSKNEKQALDVTRVIILCKSLWSEREVEFIVVEKSGQGLRREKDGRSEGPY